MWIYNGSEFTSDMIKKHHGFVYEITDTYNAMKYIGKKKFWSKVTRPPLKGSNAKVKYLVEEDGPGRFKRAILRLCDSPGELTYYEMKEQIDKEVLFKPDEYYNAFIGGKIHRNHVLKQK